MTSLKNMTLVTIITALFAATSVANDNLVKKFGTIAKPNYPITLEYKDTGFPTQILGFDLEKWDAIRDVIDIYNKRVTKCEEKVSSIEYLLQNNKKPDSKKMKSVERNLKSLKNDLIDNTKDLYPPKYDKRERRFNPEVYFELVFERLTGKKMPDVPVIKVDKFENPKRFGTYSYRSDGTSEIRYRDSLNVVEFESLAHEAGHMIAMHEESGIYDPNTAKMMEEACGNASTNAHIFGFSRYRPNYSREIKDRFDANMIKWTYDYYNGKDDEERHGAGAALFVASTQVLDNPYIVFNYLQKTKFSDIDPRIISRMKENGKSPIYEVEKLGTRFKNVVDRWNACTKK